ncbi:MAG TPA: hypothetical protein VIM57_09685 [Luteolibacter sp.]
MKQLRIILNTTLAVFSLGASQAFADPYAVGSKVASFSATDQHGAAFTFDAKDTRYLLVSFDMETGKKANAALNALGKDYLSGKHAVYVANIHGMPAVGRFFALPKMRKYAHRIILGDDANLLAPYPQQAGKVTVLKLDDAQVRKVSYWDPSAEGLDALLK